jgi:hypothetical protein
MYEFFFVGGGGGPRNPNSLGTPGGVHAQFCSFYNGG